MMEEFARNKNKERLLAEAKALRRKMKLGKSAALLIRDRGTTTIAQKIESRNI